MPIFTHDGRIENSGLNQDDQMTEHFPTACKVWVSTMLLTMLFILQGMQITRAESFVTAERIELDRFLGVWYEIAHKPDSAYAMCDRDIVAIYTFNENGNVVVDHRCYRKNGQLKRMRGEAFIENPPLNSKFSLSFLPEAIRWMPLGRENYWILKFDEHNQVVLIGEPNRQSLRILSRQPHLDSSLLKLYLDYVQALDYDISDLIYPEHSKK